MRGNLKLSNPWGHLVCALAFSRWMEDDGQEILWHLEDILWCYWSTLGFQLSYCKLLFPLDLGGHFFWKGVLKYRCLIASMIHEMKEKFQKHWDLYFLQICVLDILLEIEISLCAKNSIREIATNRQRQIPIENKVHMDPRFKLGFLEFCPRQWFEGESSSYFPTME